MEIGEQFTKLAVGEICRRHQAVTMKNDVGQAPIGGRRAGGHGLELGKRLQAGAVQRAGTGGVVAAGAVLTEDRRSASFLRGPLRRRHGRRKWTAPRKANEARRREGQSKISSNRPEAHLLSMIQASLGSRDGLHNAIHGLDLDIAAWAAAIDKNGKGQHFAACGLDVA